MKRVYAANPMMAIEPPPSPKPNKSDAMTPNLKFRLEDGTTSEWQGLAV